MEDKFLDKFFQPEEYSPEGRSLDSDLDEAIKLARDWSEDLREEKFYTNKPWLEMRDSEHFHQSILHFFNDGGEYLKSIDGDVQQGSWRYLPAANKLMISGHRMETELYDLAFMDGNFFILSKHGDQRRLKKPVYFVMVKESVGKKIQWNDISRILVNQYRDNNNYYVILALVVLAIVAIIMALSSF